MLLNKHLILDLLRLPKYWLDIYRADKIPMHIRKEKWGKHSRQYYLFCEAKVAAAIPQSKKTLVVYLHGGGWMLGTPEKFIQNVSFFCEQGYSVIAPSYRRVPSYNVEDMMGDLQTGISEAVQNGTDHSGTKLTEKFDSVIFAGMSAGAHLSALLSLKGQELFNIDLLKNCKALIAIGGPLSLEDMPVTPPLHWLVGKPNSERFKKHDPRQLLTKEAQFPMLCIYSGKDGIVPAPASSAYVKAAENLSLNIVSHFFPNENHLSTARWSLPNTIFNEKVRDFFRRNISG